MQHDDSSEKHPPGQPAVNANCSDPGMLNDPQKSNHGFSRLSRNSQWATIIVAPFVILGAILAILPLVNQPPSAPNDSASQTQPSSDARRNPTPTANDEAVAGGLEPGICLSDSRSDATRVSCQLHHTTEVFATSGECNETSLITYLGGNPSIDILRNDLKIGPLSDGACAVTFPSTLTATTSIQGALARDQSAMLRQCVNDITGADVDCGEKHTSEVIAIFDKTESSVVDCDQVAAIYMGISPADLFKILKVDLESTSDGFRCVVTAKGGNQLTDTLRMLGTSSPPISSY